MCKECGCEEGLRLVCPACGGRMVLIDGKAVCTVCASEADPSAVPHTHAGEDAPHTHFHEPAHSHEHPHTHAHAAAVRASTQPPAFDELTRLRVLLPYWREQRHDYLRDLRTWATVARAMGQAEAAARLEDALAAFDEGDQALMAALTALDH